MISDSLKAYFFVAFVLMDIVGELKNKYQNTQSACRQLWQPFSCLNMSRVRPNFSMNIHASRLVRCSTKHFCSCLHVYVFKTIFKSHSADCMLYNIRTVSCDHVSKLAFKPYFIFHSWRVTKWHQVRCFQRANFTFLGRFSTST